MQIIFKGKDKGHMLCMANEHTNQNFRCFVRKTSRVLQHWEFCYNHTCNNSKIKLVILALNVHPGSSIIQWPRLAWIQKVVYLLFIFFILYSNSKFKYRKKKHLFSHLVVFVNCFKYIIPRFGHYFFK